MSKGDLYINRYRNQLVTYTPYTYLNKKKRAEAVVPLQYNTCETMVLKYDKLSSGVIREFADHIDFYLNNYRTDTTAVRTDTIIITGCTTEPVLTFAKHKYTKGTAPSALQKYGAESMADTVVVKHCGAVDISISCSGAADRSAMTDAIAITPLPLPNQPELYRGPILIEAEDMDFKNVKNCCTDPYGWYNTVRGHAGNGFVDMGTNSSGALRHQLKLKEGQEGDYVISLRYTCSSKAGKIRMTVNGSQQTVSCEKTAVNEWKWVTVNATLKASTNTLIVTNFGALPMYIDQVCYRPADVAPMTYFVDIKQAEEGTVVADKAEAAEGDTITLTINADQGYSLQELRVVNSVFYTLEKTIDISQLSTASQQQSTITFVMPGDNVTLQPVFKDVSSVAKLDFSGVVAGAIPEGWRCVQENNEVHAYPSNYSLGARTMAGFTGYQGKALYWRTTSAEYGRLSNYKLTLEPGNYVLVFATAAWKGSPTYQAKIHSFYRHSLVIHYPRPEYSIAENILYMLRADGKFTKREANLLDAILVIHADHGGGNNSTFTTVVMGSTGTDLYSAICGSIGSLKGPKHGGANISVNKMMKQIIADTDYTTNKEEVRSIVRRILNRDYYDRSGLIYGFGHAVYTISDPRAELLRGLCQQLADEQSCNYKFRFYELFEETVKEEVFARRGKVIPANVDYYSGFAYDMLGIPEDLFTPLFAIARVAGWVAHNLENKLYDGKIMRPATKYVGEHCKFVPMDER